MNKKQLFGRDWKEIYGLRLCPKKYGNICFSVGC